MVNKPVTDAKGKENEEKQKKTKNLILKIICIFLAILLWGYVSYDKNPTASNTFKNIPVSIVGIEGLESRNLTVLSSDITASVKLSGDRNILSKVNKEDIKAVVDVSDITTIGEQNPLITISGIPSALSVDERKIVSGKLVTDALVKKNLEINIEIAGEIDDTVIEEERTVNPAQVTIKGPSTLLSDISAYTTAIDITNINKSENKFNAGVVLKNSEGEIVESNMITMYNKEVEVTINCKGKKEVKFIEPDIVGSLEGYNVIIEKIEPSTVFISGTPEDLALIDSLELSDIDAYFTESSKTYRCDIILPENVECETTRVNVTVSLEKLVQEDENSDNEG